jgi:hypothetical protein
VLSLWHLGALTYRCVLDIFCAWLRFLRLPQRNAQQLVNGVRDEAGELVLRGAGLCRGPLDFQAAAGASNRSGDTFSFLWTVVKG